MADIFLSYSREDRPFAEALTRLVEQGGHNVWWDRDIDSGSEFSGEIEAALERADVVLVAWSRASAKSAWVRDEAAIGRDTGRLVPVVIDGSQPPIGFRQFQALDLTGWKGGKKDPRGVALLGDIARRVQAKGGDAQAPRHPEPKPPVRPRKPTWIVAAMLLALIGAVGTGLFIMNRGQAGGQGSKPTIALVPFTTASPDPQLRDTAGQVRDALSHTLAQSGVPVRLLDSAPANGRAAGDFLIAGEISKNAASMIATVRLVETTQGVTVYSTRFEANQEQVRDFPERIGAQMAGMLSNGATLLTLDRGHPLDPALITELLSGDNSGDQLQIYQMYKRVAAKAPDVASTQVGVAFFTGFVIDQLPRAERPQALAEGRRAYERALQLAPKFGDTYAAWCGLHSESQRIDCENNLRKGGRIDPDAPYLNGFLAGLLLDVGRFDEALRITRLSYSHDPYDFFKIRGMLRMFEASGDGDEARNLYQDGARWWPDAKTVFFRGRILGLASRGDFEAMGRVEKEVGAAVLAPGYLPSTAIAAAVKARSVPALRKACPKDANFVAMIRCMIAFSTVGDLDSAYAIADNLYPARVGSTPAETERIWIDDPANASPLAFITSAASAPMRRDSRFLALAERTGLLAYWRSGRLPDFCRKNPEPVCSQLRGRH